MSRRSRIRRTAGAVAASAAALVAVQGSSAGAADEDGRAAKRTTVCAGTRPADGPADPGLPTSRVPGYADKWGETRYRSVYTGLTIDEETRTVDVYRIPSAAFDADICAQAEKGVRVRFHDTDVTHHRLMALVDRVGDDMGRWDGTFDLREVGPDPRGFVFFGVDDPATADLVLKKDLGKFWAKHIRVEYAAQASLL